MQTHEVVLLEFYALQHIRKAALADIHFFYKNYLKVVRRESMNDDKSIRMGAVVTQVVFFFQLASLVHIEV